jgi:2',3'-cyclic-nucleotide 2'-phosphodiesterase (5'-nucleotidase family)
VNKVKSFNPEWNQKFQFKIPDEKYDLILECWEKSKFIGKVEINFKNISIERKQKFKLIARNNSEAVKGEVELKFDLDSIKEYVERKYDIFGASLDEIMSRKFEENDCPIVLNTIVNFIKENGLKISGIFRIPGDSKNMEKFIQRIDKGEIIEFSKDGKY